MPKKLATLIVLSFVLSSAGNYGYGIYNKASKIHPDDTDRLVQRMIRKEAPRYAPVVLGSASFYDNFDTKMTLQEGGSMGESASKYWWLNSGAYFYNENGKGSTVQGSLPTLNTWRVAYSIDNPEDTDKGYHPQNIFRLVTRSKWKNFVQEAYFKINKYNLSSSSERAASNGLLFFNRYQDGQTLYYTGLRVDGALVVKKKYNGTYYTMAYKKYFGGTYDRTKNPNLLPVGTWIGLKSEVYTDASNKVQIKVYMDVNRTGKWINVLNATDSANAFGKSIIANEGFAGIRTDFMDAEFEDYKIQAK